MAIRLGLQRMERLYGSSTQPWKAIHVAGTNGKGSICAYISSILRGSGISYGRFTSPFIHRPEDSITINEVPISHPLFTKYYEASKPSLNDNDPPTPFERLTFAAFQALDAADIKYGVIETGLGGRLDSTNVLKHKAVSVVSKIGLDHQEFLGATIEEIAAEKAGIINGAPCVVDGTNPTSVLEVIASKARQVGSKLVVTTDDVPLMTELHEEAHRLRLAQHEVENMACAILACREGCPEAHIPPISTLALAKMPGRLQSLQLNRNLVSRRSPVIVDGAHNLDGVSALTRYVNEHLRPEPHGQISPVTWVLALSQPRMPVAPESMQLLFKPNDKVVFTTYAKTNPKTIDLTNPESWAAARPECISPDILTRMAKTTESIGLAPENLFARHELDSAVRFAAELAGEGPMVVAGSLYLVSDFLAWNGEV